MAESDDLVNRLRMAYFLPTVCTEAADEIELLRKELWRRKREGNALRNAAVEIVQLRKERDEARRQVCQMREANGDFVAEQQAEMRGWDCFKDVP